MSSPARSRVTRGHSCYVCYQRKVKCDGKRPCATCVKTGRSSECKDTRPKDGVAAQANIELLVRLRRYEALLVEHGVPLDGQPSRPDTAATAASTSTKEVVPRDGTPAAESDDGKMIIQSGHPRFVESAIWSHIGSELAEHLPSTSDDDESDLGDAAASPDDLVFGRQGQVASLETLHPSVAQILRLWQIFLADFYPLVMIFHAPSIQHVISESIANLAEVTSNTEALLFSIYLCAVTSMTNQDCLSLLGEQKETVLARYSKATQQALVEAQFLRSNDLIVLQALSLYLLASRRYIHSQALWLLSGLASRLAQTMGLHREHGLKHLSPYDAEVRRRLWWQIIALDNRSAQLSGATTEGDFSESFDTRRPLNVHDSDLSPFMSELPAEHDGPTDMLFCTVRLEIGDCMRQLKIVDKTTRGNPIANFKQKEQAIDALESRIERIVSRCDSSIPVHLLTLFLGRSSVSQKRLAIRHEAHQREKETVVPQEERDALFRLALQIMVYDHLTYSTKSLRPYLWHVETYFPFQALIVILMELIRRDTNEDIDQAWTRVFEAYEDHTEMLDDVKNPLHFAVGSLTIRAWEKRMTAADPKMRGSLATTHPIIVKLQAQRLAKPGGAMQPHATQEIPMDITPSQFNMVQANYGMGPGELNHILSGVNDMPWPDWQQFSGQ